MINDMQPTSEFNEAAFQISRLDQLYLKANTASQNGDFDRWNRILNTIWRELSPDAIHLYGLNDYTKDVDTLNKHIALNWENRSKLYFFLNLKDIYLRHLQDISGKGSKRGYKYEELM